MTAAPRAGPLVAGVALVVVVGGAVLLVGGMVGLRDAGSDAEGDAATTTSTTTPTVTTAAPTPTTVAEGRGPTVRMAPAERGERAFPRPLRAVGGLEPTTVLSVVVERFPPFAVARARQCVARERAVCGNAIAVQFGENGTASFQYLVHRDFAEAAGCGARAATCSVVVEDSDGEGRAEVVTVFGEPVPAAGRVEVAPRTGLRDGQTVQVTATGQPPGADLVVEVCAAPTVAGDRRCGAPGPVAETVVGADGTATATLTIREGPIGTDRVFCRRGQACGVVVRSGSAVVRTGPVPIGFAAPPGAGYDAWRLRLGLAAAAALVAIAIWWIRRTDWSPVGEVAAPEIDDAEYADLDAIVAALPPEPEPEPAAR